MRHECPVWAGGPVGTQEDSGKVTFGEGEEG